CLSNAAPPSLLSTLSLHDALPIFWPGPEGAVGGFRSLCSGRAGFSGVCFGRSGVLSGFLLLLFGFFLLGLPSGVFGLPPGVLGLDRKSTRLNSSHVKISYAVFCLK